MAGRQVWGELRQCDPRERSYSRWQGAEASANKNSYLFWAIKGGGGNFGIISQLELRLHPLDQVFGGVATYSGDFAAFLRFYRDFMKEAPADLTVEINIRQLGKPTLLATACWSGNPRKPNVFFDHFVSLVHRSPMR
jgi:hypothetical protein